MIRAIVGYILDWLLGKAIAFYQLWRKQKAADDAIDKRTQKEADDLKKSKTDDEDERAAKEILSRK